MSQSSPDTRKARHRVKTDVNFDRSESSISQRIKQKILSQETSSELTPSTGKTDSDDEIPFKEP